MASLAFALLTISIVGSSQGIEKPYTLKIPMNMPLGGPINPMGPMCTESVTMALNALNSNPSILPKYKIQIDLGDDQCLSTAASLMSLQFYENLKPVVPSARVFGNLTLPVGANFSQDAYVPPLYLGGLCSPTCVTAGRLPQQYGYINLIVGCTEPQFTNRKLYPNFYRFAPSFVEVEKFRAKLMHYLGWNRMGYLADAVQTTYDDAIYFAKAILGAGKKVAAEEFYMDQEAMAESIARLKANDVRVIYGNCYVNFCPAMACEAYRQGLYGPNIIWIFNSWIDVINGQLTPGCTKSMVQEFAEYSFYIGPDFLDGSQSQDFMTDAGVTLRQFNQYMGSKIKDIESEPTFSWRLIPFDDIVIGAKVLHNVELQLNRKNETLKDVISDAERRLELSEMIRYHTKHVDVKGLYGRAAFLPGLDESYNPPLIVEQYYKGQRATVLIARDRNIADPQKYFEKLAPLHWGTRDGLPIRTEPREAQRKVQTDRNTTIGFIAVTAITLSMKWAVQFLAWAYEYNFSGFNFLTCLGSTLIAVSVLVYPLESADLSKLNIFCAALPPLALLGFSLMFVPLVLKLWASRYIPEERNTKLHYSMLTTWMVIQAGLIEAWYLGEIKPTAIASRFDRYDSSLDTRFVELTYLCQFVDDGGLDDRNPIASLVLIGLQGMIFVAAIILAIGSTRKRARHAVTGRTTFRSRITRIKPSMLSPSSVAFENDHSTYQKSALNFTDQQTNQDVKDTSLAIYCLASMLLLVAFALAVFSKSPSGLISIVTTFSLASTLAMTFLLQRQTLSLLLFKMGVERFDPGQRALTPDPRSIALNSGQKYPRDMISVQSATQESNTEA